MRAGSEEEEDQQKQQAQPTKEVDQMAEIWLVKSN